MQLMADEPSNGDIMGAIGTLQGRFDGIIRELDNAAASRRVLHEQIEAQGKVINNVSFGLDQQVQIQAQVREEVKGLHQVQTQMKTDIEPLLEMKDELPSLVDAWKDMSKWSKRVVYLLGVGGISVLAAAYWLGGLITQAVKHWLGLPPG